MNGMWQRRTTSTSSVRFASETVRHLWCLVGCLIASRIELNAEPSDQGGGFGAEDTGHFE